MKVTVAPPVEREVTIVVTASEAAAIANVLNLAALENVPDLPKSFVLDQGLLANGIDRVTTPSFRYLYEDRNRHYLTRALLLQQGISDFSSQES